VTTVVVVTTVTVVGAWRGGGQRPSAPTGTQPRLTRAVTDAVATVTRAYGWVGEPVGWQRVTFCRFCVCPFPAGGPAIANDAARPARKRARVAAISFMRSASADDRSRLTAERGLRYGRTVRWYV